jgi:hypothetical protein
MLAASASCSFDSRLADRLSSLVTRYSGELPPAASGEPAASGTPAAEEQRLLFGVAERLPRPGMFSAAAASAIGEGSLPFL